MSVAVEAPPQSLPDPTPPARAPSRRRSLWLTAFFAVSYLWSFNAQPAANNPNENVRLYMTAAMVDDGTYAIDRQRAEWGWCNDAGVRDGHYYSVKAPGTSFLGVPGYAAYRALVALTGGTVDKEAALWAGRFSAAILPCLFFLFFFHRWLARRTRSPWTADAVTIALALGCNFFTYGMSFASHATSAICAFGAFMLLIDARQDRAIGDGKAFFAGMLTAGVTFFEYHGALTTLLLGGFALFAIRPWRQLVPYIAGGLAIVAVMMHFHATCFGGPFTPGHLFVENEAFRAGHQEGLYGASVFHPEGAWKLLVGPYHGLFGVAAFFFLAIPGFFLLMRKPRAVGSPSLRLPTLVALAICVLSWLLISFFNIWHAGWTIGPRYLTHLYPFVAWAAAAAIDAGLTRWPRAAPGVVVGLLTASLIATGVPSVIYPHPPPEFTRPLGQIYAILIDHGYAPRNVGQLIGLHGTASLVPLFLAWAALVAWLIARDANVRTYLMRTGLAAVACAAFILPLTVGTSELNDEQRKDVAYVARNWTPAGDNDVARLRAGLERDGGSPEEWRALADLYSAEGRDDDAKRALRGMKRARPLQ